MLIAAMYECFITWQNQFLEKIINSNCEEKDLLYYFSHNLKNEIGIQEAKNANIIKVDDINLEEIINQYTKRDIYNKDGSIDYKKYNCFIYDFDSIEKKLGEKILTGVCSFKEDSLKFVTFWTEENPEILTKFQEIYTQEELNKKEKETIEEYLKNMYTTKKNNFNPKELFSSFQQLFSFLNDRKNKYHEEKTVNNLLEEKIFENLQISENFRELFMNEKGKELKLSKIVNIYLYIEHLCFKELSKSLDNKFKSPIEYEKQSKIDFNKQKIKEPIRDELPKALRRYISRYLISNKKKNKEELENKDLIIELYKSDLWWIKIKMDDIKKELNTYLKDFNLKVAQSFTLYELIGTKDKEFIKSIINDKMPDDFDPFKDPPNDDEDNEDNEDNENERIL
jgi:hypothetical protein